MKQTSDLKNLVIALALSTLILVGWQFFIETPRKKAEALAQKMHAHAELEIKKEAEINATAFLPQSRAESLADSPRVRIQSDNLHGSIALKGLRFDDLTLAKYHETLDKSSPEVVLLSPSADANSYFAEFGWVPGNKSVKLPTPDTVWASDSETLTSAKPITLSWENGEGITFTVKIALDEKYMFTLTQSAKDADGKDIALQSYAYINRVYDIKTHPALGILHEGPLGVFDGTLQELSYKKLLDEKEQHFETESGWMGISDKYWLSAIVPPAESFNARFSSYVSKGRQHFQTDYLSPEQPETTLHFFTGAKELSVLDDYAARYHIPLFDRAVDFGMFYFLTKPIFLTLNYFYALIGNFGIAILLLTVLVKLLMFPLANKSFKAMNHMKELQPKMNEIRERCKDDKLKMNQEVMELYKREKVNPASGCLPLFVQIPVFFSLYKVLYVTIEMRQANFFGWVHDLSASDPTNLFTLFGMLNWQPPALLHLGIWPMIMCATMIIQQTQSPPPPDPVQAKIMKLLPFFFLYLFSSFPAGLVIYWSWSNTLSILQQWYIKEKHSSDKAKKIKAK